MISFQFIIFVLVIHWLADFALQTHEQAINKSKSVIPLLQHIGMYSAVWMLVSTFLFDHPIKVIAFTFLTFACHFMTDYVTSRVGKPFWEKGDTHNGFTVVGFDQILHYIQLFGTYLLLK